MADFLFIRLADDAATWAAFDAAGRILSSVGRGALAAARPAAEGRRVVVVVPAIDVITAHAELPAGSQARLRQILPYSLEDAVAEDIEQLAFAVGQRLPSGAVSAAIVAKQRLERWLTDLHAAGLVPHAIYSEAEGVPEIPGTLTLLIEGPRVYGRRAGQPPFVLEGLGIAQVVALLRGGADEAPDLEHVLVYTDDAGRAQQRSGLAELKDAIAQVEVKVAVDGLFPRLAATLAQRPGTNLLQGAYAPKSNWIALARPWRVAAALLLVTGLLAFVGQAVEYVALRREDGALAELVAASCERVVATTRMPACEAEVQRRLREAGAGAGSSEGFLTTLAAVAAARDPDTRIDALNYRNQVMDLRLVAASVPALDQFARDLEQTQRFATKMESTNQSDAGIEGRIQIVGVDR